MNDPERTEEPAGDRRRPWPVALTVCLAVLGVGLVGGLGVAAVLWLLSLLRQGIGGML